MTIVPDKEYVLRQKKRVALTFTLTTIIFVAANAIAYLGKASFMKGVDFYALIAMLIILSFAMVAIAFMVFRSINNSEIIIENKVLAHNSLDEFRFIDLTEGFQISRQGNFWIIANMAGDNIKVRVEEYPDLKSQVNKEVADSTPKRGR